MLATNRVKYCVMEPRKIKFPSQADAEEYVRDKRAEFKRTGRAFAEQDIYECRSCGWVHTRTSAKSRRRDKRRRRRGAY